MKVINKFNPEGILETLKRWYASENRDRWVCFDGVSVSLHDRLEGLPDNIRAIGTVSDIASVVGEDAHLTLQEFLYNDF